MSGWAVTLRGGTRPRAELPAPDPGAAEALETAIAAVAAVSEQVSRATLEYARQCVNPAELLQHVDTVTEVKRGRAYYRLLELAAEVPAVRQGCEGTTLHLCEAPGNFVDGALAVSGHRANWHAMSLVKPNAPQFYEHLVCAKKPNGHARVIFGERGDGDVLVESNVACVVHEVGAAAAALVTADADAASPATLASEIRIALLVLAKGGCLVLRLDGDGPEVRAALALLRPLFGTVGLRRLAVTNPCDPERYAVCSEYVGGSAGSKRAVDALVDAIAADAPVAVDGPVDDAAVDALMQWIDRQRADALVSCAAVARHLDRIGVADRPRCRAHYSTDLVAVPWMLDIARQMIRKYSRSGG